MASRKQKKSQTRRLKSLAKATPETRTADAMTVAWTVSVTTVLLCDLACVAATFYVNANPEAKRMLILQALLLFAGGVVGIVSLALLPIVYRVRSVPPPRGLVVFGVCVAGAPLLALLARVAG